MLIDKMNALWGSIANGVIAKETEVASGASTNCHQIGERANVNLHVVLGTIQNAGAETYEIKIQSHSSCNFSENTGDIVTESEYTIDKDWSDLEKDFTSKLTHAYMRGYLTIGGGGSIELAVFVANV